jgi:2'-5' RNA ligase
MLKPCRVHLTIKFLGDMPEADIAAVTAAMQRAAHGRAPLSLTHQGLGVFPGIKRPRVLWTGLGGEVDRLRDMVGQLESELEPLGFKREGRPFKAHLTLARIKGWFDPHQLLAAIQALGGYPPLTFEATRMVLYQSRLRPQGATYTVRAGVELGSPPQLSG